MKCIYQASDGWLWNFNKRFAINNYQMRREKLSNDKETAKEYSQHFQETIVRKNMLTSCTLAQRTETDV